MVDGKRRRRIEVSYYRVLCRLVSIKVNKHLTNIHSAHIVRSWQSVDSSFYIWMVQTSRSDSWFARARLDNIDSQSIHAEYWLDSIVSSYQKKRDWSERVLILVSSKADIDDSHVQDSTALIHRAIQTRFGSLSYERRGKWQRIDNCKTDIPSIRHVPDMLALRFCLSVCPDGKRSLWASDHTIVMDGPEWICMLPLMKLYQVLSFRGNICFDLINIISRFACLHQD